MNKDIQTLIEREANTYAVSNIDNPKSLYSHLSKQTQDDVFDTVDSSFQAGASFALSLFKWRKVSDELPKNINNVLLLKNGKVHQGYYSSEKKSWFVFQYENMYFRYENITHWMPIPQID